MLEKIINLDMLSLLDKHRGCEQRIDYSVNRAKRSNPEGPQFGYVKVPCSYLFFSQITRMACVGIAVYIMFVCVDIANIIITPEKHFTTKHWT